jgi:type I restriction enzyme, S subunit
MSNDGAGAVTIMEDKSHGNAPKLRFPEFVGNHLHDTRLGEVTKECKSRNRGKFAADVVMGVSKEVGIVPMQARLVADDIARYKIVRKDWFAYNPMRLNIGSIARWQGDNVVLVSPDYVVFCCTEIDEEPCLRADYLDHFRRSTHWSAFTGEAGDGGVRVRIYYDDIAKVRLILPDGEEQQKIAACLSSLDTLISAETDKLELLRDHKKGLMQQLFPRLERVENGVKVPAETTPRFRFPEFRDAEEWKPRKLKDISLPVVERVGARRLTPVSISAGVGFVPQTEKFGRDISGKQYQLYTRVKKGDFVYNKGNSIKFPQGCVYDLRDFDEVAAPNVFISFKLKHGYENEFFRYCFEGNIHGKQLAPHITSGARSNGLLNLGKDVFFDVVIYTPDIGEQKRIGRCLSVISEKITAQADKVDSLKAHKIGLMQQLFPSPKEATA